MYVLIVAWQGALGQNPLLVNKLKYLCQKSLLFALLGGSAAGWGSGQRGSISPLSLVGGVLGELTSHTSSPSVIWTLAVCPQAQWNSTPLTSSIIIIHRLSTKTIADRAWELKSSSGSACRLFAKVGGVRSLTWPTTVNIGEKMQRLTGITLCGIFTA